MDLDIEFYLFYNDLKKIVNNFDNELEYNFDEIISGDTNNNTIKLVFGGDEEEILNKVILNIRKKCFQKYLNKDSNLSFSIDKVYVDREDWFVFYIYFNKKYMIREWYELSMIDLSLFLAKK